MLTNPPEAERTTQRSSCHTKSLGPRLETMMRLPACLFRWFIEGLSEQNRPADVARVHHISDDTLRKPKMYLKGIATLCSAALCPDKETHTIRAAGRGSGFATKRAHPNFYVSVFKNSKVKTTTHYTGEEPSGQKGSVMTLSFEEDGQARG
jgi:hypothetical protein